MPIAYYAQAATEVHWTELWQQNQLEQLLKKAEKQGAIVLMMSAGKLRADVKVEIPQK